MPAWLITRPSRWSQVRFTLALGVLLIISADLVFTPWTPFATRVVDDAITVLAAFTAVAAALWRASQLTSAARNSWLVMAAAFCASAFGEFIWAVYELVLKRDPVTPSAADIAYLMFPVLALVALSIRPGPVSGGQGRLRNVLDGFLVAASLFNISWVTALGATYDAGGDTATAFAIALAYPVSDIVLVTVTLIALVHSRRRRGLTLLAAGLIVQALTDSIYSYLSAKGQYSSGNLIDIGYVLGYLLLAEAALRDNAPEVTITAQRQPRTLSTMLPYIPAVVGIGIGFVTVRAGTIDPAVMVGRALVVILLLRQLLTLLDNKKLVTTVLSQQDALHHLAFHDPLTALANRALFTDRLEHAVTLHERDLRPVAVLVADLDDFKHVNDSLGHDAGDQLLTQVANRLRGATRAGDTVARLGGDEFAVLLENSEDSRDVAERILRVLQDPVIIGSRPVPVRISIGVARLDPDAAPASALDLLKQADLAMYLAKQRGKNTIAEYEPGGLDNASWQFDLRTDLLHAIESGHLEVHFQPIVDFNDTLVGFESLSRWCRQGQWISPEVFLTLAELSGSLGRLDESVLDATLKFAQRVDIDRKLQFHVNIAASELADPSLGKRVQSALAHHHINGRRLVLEIPESKLLPENGTDLALNALRERGIRLALDDFGVGWSSLQRLQTCSPDIVKIDRCFVQPLTDPAASTDIVSSIISLGHQMGATVIAEGVEDSTQRARLQQLGCDALQGFLIARPMPASQAESFSRELRAVGRIVV